MELVKLHKICDLKNGFAFKSKDYVDSSNTLSCRMSSIRPGGNFDLQHNQRFLPDQYAELYSEYLLYDGDIVIAMTDLAGDPKILGVPTIVKTGGKNLLQNQRVGKLVVKDVSKVFIPFLQYALNRPVNKNYYKKFASGGLQINVGKKEVLNNSVPLPPLETQKKIAAVLNEADKLRQLDKQLIDKYDALSQSLFLDMFGDPLSNPKGWDKNNLSEVCFKITDGTHKTPLYQDSGVIFLSAKNIKNFTLNKESPKFISELEHNQLSKRCNVEFGDILLTKSGSLGMAALVHFQFPFSIFESLALIKYQPDRISGTFLVYFLNTPSTQFQYNQITKGVGVKHLHLKDLRRLDIILPPLKLQIEFTERVEIIESQKVQAIENLKKSENLFNSLMQKAFKGELV